MFEAFIAGTAKPQGSKTAYARNNRVIMFEANKKLPEWRNHAIKVLSSYAPPEPLGGALVVCMFFYFEKPKTSKRDKPNVKPDLDKLARAMADALTQSGVIQDDSRITEMHLYKAYSDVAGCLITIQHAE
jgi:Holliday junction resolvase RusA-like endonuclease